MTTPDLAEVSARLAAAERRARLNLWADAAARGVAAGAGLWLFFEAVRRILPEGFFRMMEAAGLGGLTPFRQSAIASALVAILVAVSVGLATVNRTPRRDRLARDADRTFGLHERLSTALEVVRADASGPIRIALIRDAAAAAPAIDVRRLEPLRAPWALLLAAVLLAAGLVLQLAPTTISPVRTAPRQGTASVVAVPVALTADERVGLVEEIRQAAAEIRADAAAAGDAMLDAVGRTLDRLGEDIAARDGLDRTEIEAELGALLRQTTTAPDAPPDAPVAAATAAAALEALIDTVRPATATTSPRLTTGPPREEGNAIEPALDADHQTPMVIGRTAERGIGDGTRQAPADRMQGNIGGIQVQLDHEMPDDDVINEARAGGTARPNAQAGTLGVETAAQPGERTAAGPGLGDDPPPNGGTQRTDLAGEAAGAGVQTDPAFVIPTEPLEYEIDHGMDIEGAVNPQGRRIQLDVPPPPPNEAIAELAPEAAAAWRLNPEAAITRRLLDPTARDFVARYFAALAAGATP